MKEIGPNGRGGGGTCPWRPAPVVSTAHITKYAIKLRLGI